MWIFGAEQVACSAQYVGKVARRLSADANEQAAESAVALRAECLATLRAGLARYPPLALGPERDDAAWSQVVKTIATMRAFVPPRLVAELSQPHLRPTRELPERLRVALDDLPPARSFTGNGAEAVLELPPRLREKRATEGRSGRDVDP